MTRSTPLQLHASLLEHCRLSGWQPRYLGQPDSKSDLWEVLKEVIACREAGASQLSRELIDLTEAQGWNSPWLEDNRAWLLLGSGQFQEAQEIWEKLLTSEDPAVLAHAKNNLKYLYQIPDFKKNINLLEKLRAKDQRSEWEKLCHQILIQGGDPFEGPLRSEVSEAVLTRQPAGDSPWDQRLLLHDQLLELFEAAIDRWEARLE